MTPLRMCIPALLAALLCLALLSLALLPENVSAARNPFIRSDKQSEQQQNATQPAAPSFSVIPSSWLQDVIRWQLALRMQMTGLARDIAHSPWGGSFGLFMAASFLYGAAHALGPGHGKAFAIAYFLDRPGPLWLGLLFGNLSMVCHVASAATLVLVGSYILRTAASGVVDDVGGLLEGISYGLLACIGLGLLLGNVYGLLRRRNESEPRPQTGASPKTLALTAMAAGLAPCPGAALVLMFCISLGVQTAGLLSLLAISLGMGVTISAFATAAIASRSLVLRMLHNRRKTFDVVQAGVSILGGAAIASMGSILLAGWWLSRG